MNAVLRFGIFSCFFALLWGEVTPARLEQQARGYYDRQDFTGVVLVARDGKVLLSKGYGLANAEWGVPNGPQTKFRLGSITKQFTAMAVLLLEQDGKLKVEDPVCRFVDPCPDAWKPLTLHHLLTHTSGIPNFTSFPDYQKTMREPSPPAESLKRFRDKPLEFAPGSKFNYSNSGYVLLGYIVEKASGQSWAEFVKKRVWEPLGMKDTGYDRTEEVLPQRASGYQRKGELLENAPFMDMSIPHGAGSMYSTAPDLMKWDSGLRAGQLLTAENYKRYYTPAKNGYAYGWATGEVGGEKVIEHGGGINGFSTMITRVPSKGLVVIALSNVLPSQSGKLAKDLLRLEMGEDVAVPEPLAAVKVPVEILKKYVGDYELAPGFVLTVKVAGEALEAQATGQGVTHLRAKSETLFAVREVEAEIRFAADGASLELLQGGRVMKATRR